MTAVSQCDYCKELAPFPMPPGWVIQAIQQEGPEGYLPSAEPVGCFCGWPCAAAYALLQSLTPADGAPAPAEGAEDPAGPGGAP